MARRIAEPQPYGDLTALNSCRLILNSVGKEILADIIGGFLDLVESSVAVYEANGDYAAGIFTSGWCRQLDQASRNVCGAADNRQALQCGKWHCHESCWQTSNASIQTNGPADLPCLGGIHIYAVPIRADGKVVGSINFGYGDPPTDPGKLAEVSERYALPMVELEKQAAAYQPRDPYLIEVAKRHLATAAELIGLLVERKRAEDRLQAMEDRLACILDTAFDGIVSVDESQRIILFNRGAEAVFQYHAEEVKGQSFDLLIPLRFVEPHRQYVRDFSLSPEKSRLMGSRREVVGRRKDGTEFPAEVSISKAFQNGKTILTGIVRDITSRKNSEEALRKAEETLRQSQKMEAIGQLAGGVAHDFNNLLTIISGYSELLLSRLPSDDPSRELLREVRKAGERAASLTRQLLAFSRQQVLEPKVLDLNAVVSDTEKMLRRLIGEDIVLTAVLAPRLGKVKVDPGQIEQVILNLAVNARDAMPQGGKLTLETANVVLDERSVQTDTKVEPGRYVMLSVSDSGCGMDQETKARIFEPFFTTKGPGKGTGLGLATVFGIVKQSGGHIRVYSELGRGTVFKVYFSEVEERLSLPRSLPGLRKKPTGTETILLVEDEDAVRGLSRYVLTSFGYTVLEAHNGKEAIRIGEQHKGEIHLVLTDVVMPEMSGRQLTERLAALRPGIKILYSSGYTDDAVVRHGILHAEVAFLQKPFTPTSLANKVRDVLDQ